MFLKRNASGTGREHYADRIVKHKLRKIMLFGMVAAILAAIIFAIWVSYKNKIYTDYQITNTYEKTSGSGAESILLADTILSYSHDGASCMDAKGKALWNETFEMQNPIVAINNDTVAIGDYGGRQIYCMNSRETLGTISTNLPIRAISVSEKGTVAAVLDDSNVTWINLYDKDGSNPVTFKTTMSQSGYPMAVSLSPSANLVAVSYVMPDHNSVKSSVAFYNFGEVGQNEIDNYMSGYDYQSVVPYVSFLNDGLAVAVSGDRLMFFEGAQKPVSKSEVLLQDELQSVYHNDTYVGLVFYDTTGEHKYVLKVYDSDGNEKMSKGFDLEYKSIVLTDELVYIYSETECIITNMFGAEKYSGTLGESISLLVPGKSVSELTIVGDTMISTVELN